MNKNNSSLPNNDLYIEIKMSNFTPNLMTHMLVYVLLQPVTVAHRQTTQYIVTVIAPNICLYGVVL